MEATAASSSSQLGLVIPLISIEFAPVTIGDAPASIALVLARPGVVKVPFGVMPGPFALALVVLVVVASMLLMLIPPSVPSVVSFVLVVLPSAAALGIR